MQDTKHPFPGCVKIQTELQIRQEAMAAQIEQLLATQEMVRGLILKGALASAGAALALAWSVIMRGLSS